MKNIDMSNLKPNRDGIILNGRTLTVQGYDKNKGFQIFYNDQEEMTSRVRGITMHDFFHYLINDDDIDYKRTLPGFDTFISSKKIYRELEWYPNQSIIVGEEISANENQDLVDKVNLAIQIRQNEIKS